MSRLPIRLRLTLAFAVAVAVVLASAGLLLYLRQETALDRTTNQGLRARAADVAALAQQADTGLRDARRRLQDPSGGLAQVLTPSGVVVDSVPGIIKPLLPRQQLGYLSGDRFFAASVRGGRVRLLAQPISAQGRRVVVVVGTSLEPRLVSLADLRTELFVGGPIALLLVSLSGYALAAAALRPVERMGEQAATISVANPGARLTVPPADDELARLGRRLNEMLGRLEAALQRERSFVADAGHELRTPLALLKTEIELALDDPESAPALAAALRSAGEETDRLSRLAEDLLLLARADTGKLPIRRSPLPAQDVLKTVVARFRRRADGVGRRIQVDAPAGLVILADRLRLEQALGNLVDNALRYGTGTVRLRAGEHLAEVELTVEDNGPGFGPGFVDRAFERFTRGDTQGRSGSGLGLAIVAAVAEAHGGRAVAGSGQGGGASVTLVLPASAREIAA